MVGASDAAAIAACANPVTATRPGRTDPSWERTSRARPKRSTRMDLIVSESHVSGCLSYDLFAIKAYL